MDDNSDDGYLPGQSYFVNKNYENNEQYEEPENDDNYNNNHYSNNNYGNEINDQNYQEDDHYDDYEYQEDNYNNSKNGNDNETYDDNINYNEYEYESSDYNHYNNDNFRYNKNNYYQNNKFHNKGYSYKNNYGSYYYNNNNNDYITKKAKESYLASFSINFILWLTLVIKKSALEKNNIVFTDNEKINKEIVDSFLKYYDIKATEEKEKTTKKNYFSINIVNIEIKKAVEKDYRLEFSIIIKEKLDIFFVDKFIEIGVIGNIYYNLYPKFNFCVKKYKLTLDEKNIILDIDVKKENYEIGMCPDYEINNKKFKQLFDKISENNQFFDKKLQERKMQGPQEVLKECLNNLYKSDK